MTRQYLFTSESVSEGHPDKLADIISDAVLDSVIAQKPDNHCACEVLITKGLVVVAGEVEWPTSDWPSFKESVAELAATVLADVGYEPANFEFLVRLNQQSQEICQGVRLGDGVIGAGDQGLMFGYATAETTELMPLPLSLSHQLMQRHADLRHSGPLPWLRPDAKAQVTIRYEDAKPVAVDSVVLSTQHAPNVCNDLIRDQVIEHIIDPVIPAEFRTSPIRILINPTGAFVIGGPDADTGLTGRKIIVDTYGGACPHGGGAFSGKDPTKVDRSAAYMARYVAKNVVSAGIAERCTLQFAYAIGVAEPISVYVDLHGTGVIDEPTVVRAIRQVFDLTPAGIIDCLDLRRPIYRNTAAYGHFGQKEAGFSWERTDKVAALLSQLPQLEGVTLSRLSGS